MNDDDVTRLIEQVDVSDITAQGKGSANKKKLPPIDQWHPPLSGDIDMTIKTDGSWYYQGTPINRHRMVVMFSTILRREDDDCYYLVTPVEKVRITVEDAPFVAVETEVVPPNMTTGKPQYINFRTNVDDWVTAGEKNPIRVQNDPATGEPRPYILIRDKLEALISRSVFYELVELAEERIVDGKAVLGLVSDGAFFSFGAF